MMQLTESAGIPRLVRVKPGALDRLGIYLQRHGLARVILAASGDLAPAIVDRAGTACQTAGIEIRQRVSIAAASFEQAVSLLQGMPVKVDAVIGLGGGRALDTAKYLAHLSGKPYVAVPTSLSNDGFCSPQSSLGLAGQRRSLPASVPFGAVVDTEVCLRAPDVLWWAGVGDLVAKLTAIVDWKLAFHANGTPIHDFAALLSDATVYQFMARPKRDLDGMRLLATALMLNGIAMGICRSSRPASGSEHLISHAVDRVAARPRLHGLQVGVAAHLVSRLQGRNTERIDTVFEHTGFWRGIEAEPFVRQEWLEAVRLAPTIKEDFYTVLSSRDCLAEVEDLLNSDARLARCFVDAKA